MSLRKLSASWAIKCYEKNAKRSPLYALSYEILVIIQEYMDPTDQVCFAISSVKLLRIFRQITVIQDSFGDTSIGVYLRFMRDDFYNLNIRKQRRIWCVHCADRHHESSFIDKMLRVPRWDRKCRSSLKLCPHMSSSLVQLKSKMAKFITSGAKPDYLNIRCDSCYNGSDDSKPIQVYTTSLEKDATTGEYILRSFIHINFKEKDKSAPYNKAREDLKALDFPACLHMRTSTESTINRLVDAETGAFKAKQMDEPYRVHCQHCKTMIRTGPFNVWITTNQQRISLGLRMDIIRNLGKLTSEDDPIWRAHLRERQLKVTQDQGDLTPLEQSWIGEDLVWAL
jgi:hypothetical protein